MKKLTKLIAHWMLFLVVMIVFFGVWKNKLSSQTQPNGQDTFLIRLKIDSLKFQYNAELSQYYQYHTRYLFDHLVKTKETIDSLEVEIILKQ